MDQRNKSSWLSTAGLFLVGFFVVGLAVVTSKPFEERFGYAETAMVSEVLPDSTSDTSGDDPVKVAQDESGEAAGDSGQFHCHLDTAQQDSIPRESCLTCSLSSGENRPSRANCCPVSGWHGR